MVKLVNRNYLTYFSLYRLWQIFEDSSLLSIWNKFVQEIFPIRRPNIQRRFQSFILISLNTLGKIYFILMNLFKEKKKKNFFRYCLRAFHWQIKLSRSSDHCHSGPPPTNRAAIGPGHRSFQTSTRMVDIREQTIVWSDWGEECLSRSWLPIIDRAADGSVLECHWTSHSWADLSTRTVHYRQVSNIFHFSCFFFLYKLLNITDSKITVRNYFVLLLLK